MSTARRRLAAGAFLIVAGPVALGSVAYACQSLATLHANPLSAPAGSTVTVFGKNYSSASTSTNIEIRLDGRAGEVIGSFSPASTINGPVTIPAGTAAGTHTLVATQFTSNGTPVSGTPGRATVQVTVAARTAADGQATTPAAAGSTDPVAAAPVAATPATPAAAPSSAAPAKSAAAPSSAAPAQASSAPAASGVAAPAAPAANVAATPAGAEAGVAAPAVSAPDAAAAAAPSAPAAGPASVNVGLLPASSESTSILPGLTLAAGLAMVLLGLVAFLKSGRNMLGRSPLAG